MAPQEIRPVTHCTFRRELLLPKSLEIFELIALINELAVEIIAAKMAQPTNADRKGLVVASIATIKTLDPFGMASFKFLANTPKNTGTVQIIIVPMPAKKVAFDTIFAVFPAKQRCPISCSITIKSKGISSHPQTFAEGDVELSTREI